MVSNNIEIKFYEFLEHLSVFLNKKIFKKSIKEWLLLVAKYSFIVWFTIIGYIGFLYYQQISKVNKAIETKQRILKSKEFQRKKIVLKLKNIYRAYHLASKYFNKKKLQDLRGKINTLYTKVIFKNKTNYIVSPIQLENFNYKINISNDISQKIKTVTINYFNFHSSVSDYFLQFLLKNTNKIFNAQKNIVENLSIDLKRKNLHDFILLAKSSSNGIIEAHMSVNYPFTTNIYKNKYIAIGFIPFDALRNYEFFSPLLIKWQFIVKEENK